MNLTLGFYIDSVEMTRAVIDGTASLGGSESACLGLARALKARGHDVHIIATKLDEDCEGVDHAGVIWHPAEQFLSLNQFIEWDVFTVLRMFPFYGGTPIRARLRLLWNQDLCTQPKPLMGSMWAVDQMVYVSDYHRRQYEDRLPELKGLPAYVTKNGFDAARVPAGVTKDPNRIIHISRPERGLRPLLQMWPAIRKANPRAEVRICRYSSMYDAQGWGQICASYDQAVEDVHGKVGGIVQLGELGKGRLYQEIAEAAVMWYPGVADFAETSCIAAVESQANGTPFVGSWKGALPETVPSGVLLKGDADSPEYQQASIAAVLDIMQGCKDASFAYRQLQKVGRAHVASYTYEAIAAEWDGWLHETFKQRYEANTTGVLRQFLHDDDHVAAAAVANHIIANHPSYPPNGGDGTATDLIEAKAAEVFCQRVIAGQDQSAEHYAAHALNSTIEVETEKRTNGRMMRCLPLFAGCSHVLDVACGNGTMAILLAQTYPDVKITGVDYAQGNIDVATQAALDLGLSDRLTFVCAPFWDFDTQQAAGWEPPHDSHFDGAFIGEFIEHVANCEGLVDAVDGYLETGAHVVYTCPHGPFSDLLARGVPIYRGHVHQFCHDDIDRVFGQKTDVRMEYLTVGISRRGADLGHWVITYRTGGGPARPRDLAKRTLTCRPLQRLSVGLIIGPNELDLRRCLDSIWGAADEIVIGDCGMGETEQAIAAEFGARVVPIGRVEDHPQGFAGVRNQVLAACTGEYFLWVDADERLLGALSLRRYFESGPYIGFALRQNHLLIDGANHYDAPIRVFKRQADIQFYGCVHEQPQLTDANTEITPSLELPDVSIAHTGYLIEPIRRDKMMRRNLPLLKRDQQMYPERRLGRLLWLRDFVNIADYEKDQAGGVLTDKCKLLLRKAVALFEQEFSSPDDRYYALARPWYESALKQLGLGMEMELALAGRRGGLNGLKAKPQRIWVRKHEDLAGIVQHELTLIKAQMHPEGLKTDPEVGLVVEQRQEATA